MLMYSKLLYTKGTTINNFAYKLLTKFYNYIFKPNWQFIPKNVLYQSILFESNAILNCFIPKKCLHRYSTLRKTDHKTWMLKVRIVFRNIKYVKAYDL